MNTDFLRVISLTVNILCLIITLLIMILYYPKKKISTNENNIYSALLLVTLFCLIGELIFYTLSYNVKNMALTTFWERIYYSIITIWMILHTIYITVISNKPLFKNIDYKTKLRLLITIIFAFLVFIFLLPIEHIIEDGILLGSSGPALIYIFFLNIFLIIIGIALVISSRKRIPKSKTIPLLTFLIIIASEIIANIFGLKLLLITLPMTLVTFLMYHTIENPDIIMIEKLNIAKDQADKANQAKTEFLSNMSHEIRTPLNAIVGFSELMIDNENLPEETKEHAKDIVDASHNLLEIVNGILDISKIEANKMEVINKQYNPREVFNSLAKLVRPRIGEKPIEFKTVFSPDLPGVLNGDVGKVKQIVLNLLTNACKYTDKGEIIFNINCVNRIEEHTCLLYISVKDTGRGIKQQDMNKLFQKFERIDEDKNTTVEGTGLGLAITKSLTEMMGGRINAVSKYEEGSTFRVYLEQEIVSMEIPEVKEEIIEVDYSEFKNKKVLIVDDSKINLKVAINIMKPYNFNITTAESGYEALEKAETQTFDIIFMDIMMPKMNGVETLRRLKEMDHFDIPVIALTADAIEGTEEKYLQSGFNGYLSKPIDRDLLNKVIHKYLGGK